MKQKKKTKTQIGNVSESDSDSEKSLTALCGDPLNPGDMIFYYHEAFGVRPIGERYASVVEIDTDYRPKILSLDNMYVLAHNYQIRRETTDYFTCVKTH